MIAISGPAGAGKTTLVQAVAAVLGDATTLFYDDYSAIASWHPDVLQWIAEGCVPDAWVQIPQMAADLQQLRAGHSIQHPVTGEQINAARYIVIEEPWGRDRAAVAEYIDFVAHINIPLDISLCRRLLRDKEKYDVLGFVTAYEKYGLHEFYQRQLRVAETADLVLDGRRPQEQITDKIVASIKAWVAG